MESSQIERMFKSHVPDRDQAVKLDQIKAAAKQMAVVIANCCPECRPKSIAYTKIEEAAMWASKAIFQNA